MTTNFFWTAKTLLGSVSYNTPLKDSITGWKQQPRQVTVEVSSARSRRDALDKARTLLFRENSAWANLKHLSTERSAHSWTVIFEAPRLEPIEVQEYLGDDDYYEVEDPEEEMDGEYLR